MVGLGRTVPGGNVMMLLRRFRVALFAIPIVVLLAACTPEPAPIATPKTVAEACADLRVAVRDYYAAASPNSTLTVLNPANLPEMNGFTIPRPTCAFELRPDPEIVAGNAFTIESFYLDYDEKLTLDVQESLEAAGYIQRDPAFYSWTSTHLSRTFSAAMLIFLEGDEHAYTEAAGGTVLELSIGQG